jgi:hypothetical protein
MNLREAVNKMLEYMNVYVDSHIPDMLVKQANRIIRLIRWYGEYAIIEKSEYKVHVDFDSLKSDLHLGACRIPNQDFNMHVNQIEFVLQNTIQTDNAWLELYLNNVVDTTISFSIAIFGGESEVYINDELIDTIVVSKQKVEYNLTKGINNIKILFNNMNNGTIKLGNIVIEEYSFKGLTTEFIPKIGTGNIALNNIVGRVTAYAECLEDAGGYIQEVLEGNVAVGALVDRLNDYFEKHHANKHKGKRMTIKKL